MSAMESAPSELPHQEALASEFDLGIDVGMARRMRQVILDETVELPVSGRSPHESVGQWQKEDLVEYGKWLCALLEIDIIDSSGPSLTRAHIERASRLNIGPSLRA